MISAVVLAVGRSQRTSAPDPLMSTGGKSVFQCILESAVASALDEIVCVTANLETVKRGFPLADKRILWLLNPNSGRGASVWVIAGLWATHPKSEGVLFLADDQPIIHKELIDALIARFRDSSALIVACGVSGEPRSPLLIRRCLFPEILRLGGDLRERELLPKYKNQTALVELKEKPSFAPLDESHTLDRTRQLT